MKMNELLCEANPYRKALQLAEENSNLRARIRALEGPAQCWREHYQEHISQIEKQNMELRKRIAELEKREELRREICEITSA